MVALVCFELRLQFLRGQPFDNDCSKVGPPSERTEGHNKSMTSKVVVACTRLGT